MILWNRETKEMVLAVRILEPQFRTDLGQVWETFNIIVDGVEYQMWADVVGGFDWFLEVQGRWFKIGMPGIDTVTGSDYKILIA